jgi:hypothetical protein
MDRAIIDRLVGRFNDYELFERKKDLLVTGFPIRLKSSSWEHASPIFTISRSDEMLLSDNVNDCRFGAFSFKLRASIASMMLPEQYRLLSRSKRGKFSRRTILLLERSHASNPSLVAAMFSMAGIENPRKLSSRSRFGLIRTSARSTSSAEILMLLSPYSNTLLYAPSCCAVASVIDQRDVKNRAARVS